MNKLNLPPKWINVYPQGTKAGDEEQAFFLSLARDPKYKWRSTASLAKETNLSPQRIDEIINKYHKKNMVFQNPANVDQWGYWERVPELVPEVKKTITQADHDKRIKDAR